MFRFGFRPAPRDPGKGPPAGFGNSEKVDGSPAARKVPVSGGSGGDAGGEAEAGKGPGL
jgi:hypothetical protein